MKAVVITGPGTIEVIEEDDPTPGLEDVVIAVASCGICGTDLHILDGDYTALPIIPGHEFAGTIVALGPDVDWLRVGDRVAADPNLPCRRCYECRRGRGNLCEDLNAIGVTKPGAAAELVCVPAENCFVLSDSVEPADASLIEPLSCAVRGFDVLKARLADNFLIYGAGTMGLMNLQLAKQAGAASVSIVDVNPLRLETARLLGCTAAVTDADELDRSRGWDVVIDCTGALAAIEDGLARVGKGGTFLQFGVTVPDGEVGVSPYRIYHEEITITGSMAVLNSYQRAGELFATGLIDPEVFITDRFAIRDYEVAVERMRSGVGCKVLVVP